MTKKKYFHLIKATIGVSVLMMAFSCEELVHIDSPATQVTGATVFTDDATATAAINGLYFQMSNGGFSYGGTTSITQCAALSSDDLISYSSNASRRGFYTNTILPTNSNLTVIWSSLYQTIYNANAVLEGMDASSTLTVAGKAQLEGEAKFVRAFCHFYLVNLFGAVPLAVSTDYKINAYAERQPVSVIYEVMLRDLQEAKELIKEEYVSGEERVRPNKSTVAAFLARVYLYQQNWSAAEAQSSELIANSNYSLLPLRDVFLKNSEESIWQLYPVTSGLNTYEGNAFILLSRPTSFALSASLLSAFEAGDNRYTNWIKDLTVGTTTYKFAYKYKVKASSVLSEYSTVFRLAEQYLIRAEARAQSGNLSGAQEDLNAIRNRAGLANTLATMKEELLVAIEKERRVELFTEWGHRWLDVIRYQRTEEFFAPLKAPDWQSTDVLYPIPQVQLDNDPAMKQNPGYF